MKCYSHYCTSFYQHCYYVKAFVDFCDFVTVQNLLSILLLFEILLTFVCKNIYCFCFYVTFCFFSYLHLNCTIIHKLCLHHCYCFIYCVISKFFCFVLNCIFLCSSYLDFIIEGMCFILILLLSLCCPFDCAYG
jgi:hypothetical protein